MRFLLIARRKNEIFLMTSMNYSWTYYSSAMSDEWCDRVIKNAKENYAPEEGVMILNNTQKVDHSGRKSILRWLNASIETDITQTIWYYGNRVNRENFNFDIRYLTELQFTEYQGSEEKPAKYDFHQDIIWNSNCAAHRKISIIIQLSNPLDYVGGDLEFDLSLPQPPASELRKRGTVIVFPSFLTHRVTGVTAGTRYSLVSWIEGSPWQ